MDKLGAFAIAIATLSIILVMLFLILAQGKSQAVDISGDPTMGSQNGSFAFNATETLEASVDDIPPWVPIIVIVGIGVILIGLVKTLKS